jgi:hypothetical protein
VNLAALKVDVLHTFSSMKRKRSTCADQGMRRPIARRIAPGMKELRGERHQEARDSRSFAVGEFGVASSAWVPAFMLPSGSGTTT